MRSVRGCLSCRLLKRKCDEVKPICLRCSKAGRHCEYKGLQVRHHAVDSTGSSSQTHAHTAVSHPGWARGNGLSAQSNGPRGSTYDTQSNNVATERATLSDPREAYLLKHFSEKPGKWLDLYYSQPHFARDVPLKARHNPLLKKSICAYAAKHLHRTRHSLKRSRLPIYGSDSRTLLNDRETEWEMIAAEYYTAAIGDLRSSLHNDESMVIDRQQISGERASGVTDETLAAMAILCCYEYMSASDTDWLAHLSGTMLMIDMQRARDEMNTQASLSPTRCSIFWNFARQDLYGAFISGGRTRLDTDDLDIWRAAGLAIDAGGRLMTEPQALVPTRGDDLISNELIWIFSKVANLLSDHRHLQEAEKGLQDNLWMELEAQVAAWHSTLPQQFQPVCRYQIAVGDSNFDSDQSDRPVPFPCVWYSSKMCASTMQTFYLIRILLLTRSLSARLTPGSDPTGHEEVAEMSRGTKEEVISNSREIFGIAMSSPTEACIYLHQTQTLYVAGQYLQSIAEQSLAMDLLERVNIELGWETGYRIKQLLKIWASS